MALDLHVLGGYFYNNIFSLLRRGINLQSVMDNFGNLLCAEKIDVSALNLFLLYVTLYSFSDLLD